MIIIWLDQFVFLALKEYNTASMAEKILEKIREEI